MRNLYFFLVVFSVLTQGLAREPWTQSALYGSPEPPKPFTTERVFPQLQFDQPVELLPLGDTGRMLLLEVGGKIFTFEDSPMCDHADLALDLTQQIDNFGRALGIGVPPDLAEKLEVYVCYAGNPVARPDGTRLSRFRVSLGDVPKLDPASEEVLLTWASGGHNGCAIRFDREGLLYFSAGDGARPYPPDEYDVSQDLSDLRATICRIDVNRREEGKGYAIPPDNPFRSTPSARAEIWAYGFRNPWRFSIDLATGKLLCGDVGWELWELIHDVQRGGNHGWSLYEGPQPIRSDIKPGPTPIIKPVIAYPHSEGLSVTGGTVYRGATLPELQGTYLYGDYVTGLLWGLRMNGDQIVSNTLLAETGLKIITFTETRDREVLVVSFDGGIYRLIKNSVADQPSTFPRRLSETGLFASTTDLTPNPGVLPYKITAHAWQNGAERQFVVAVPQTLPIQLNAQQRNWKYPTGTAFGNTISQRAVIEDRIENRRIETQVLVFDGVSWQPYTYAWNREQTDAHLVEAEGGHSEFLVMGTDENNEAAQPWRFHSRAECRACHSNQAGGAVAFTLANLASIAGLSSTTDPASMLVSCGLVEKVPPALRSIERMVDPADAGANIETRARSYLAANCAHCHCRGGGGTVALDVSFGNASDAIFAIDFPATQGTFAMESAKVIVPGNPYRSVLYYRMATSGTGHMPKLWPRDNDRLGLSVIHDWIASLENASQLHRPETRRAESSDMKVSGETQVDVSTALAMVHQLDQIADPIDRVAQSQSYFASADPLTRGLFERFMPASKREQRLGNNISVEEFLSGDVSRYASAEAGRERFLNSRTQQCRNCHRFAGQGRSVGPDLDAIAKKRSRAELLESILEPSKKIEPEFVTYSVVTVDGQVFTGLRIGHSEKELVIRSADAVEHRIANEDIEHLTPQTISLMPIGLAAEMTATELADLLEFLSSQK